MKRSILRKLLPRPHGGNNGFCRVNKSAVPPQYKACLRKHFPICDVKGKTLNAFMSIL
jgi:hypothetical protein